MWVLFDQGLGIDEISRGSTARATLCDDMGPFTMHRNFRTISIELEGEQGLITMKRSLVVECRLVDLPIETNLLTSQV